MYESIFKNLPSSPAWQGSFCEALAEDAVWDRDEFWRLHLELIKAGHASRAWDDISRELAGAVARIQSRVLGLIAAHYDPHDVFVIENLHADELRAYTERFDHAVLGVFSGEVLSESMYDLRSPLIGLV